MAGHDIVAIGGSAGGVEALRQICHDLPADFPAAVFAVLHISPASRSILPELLTRAGPLPAHHPYDGEHIVPGHIYVAPPDLHMLLQPGRVILRRGPYENRTRPAINPLFRSAAVHYRTRVIGVLLSGLLDDGAAGLTAITLCGGLCAVQDPDDAIWGEMPRNALRHERIDHVVPASGMAALLSTLVQQPPPDPPPDVPANLVEEARLSARETPVMAEAMPLGRPTRLSCPQCGGVLQEVGEQGSTRFRCQVGHAFTADGLLDAQHDELERALESALRLHRDRVALFRRMQQQTEAKSLPHAAAHWRAGADASEHSAALIEQAIDKLRKPTAATREDE